MTNDIKQALHAVALDPFLLRRCPLQRHLDYSGCGIYFVFVDNAIKYIGVAKNIGGRWLQHHLWQRYKEQLQNAEIAWTLPANSQLEYLLIYLHKPAWNGEIRRNIFRGGVVARWTRALTAAQTIYAGFERQF